MTMIRGGLEPPTCQYLPMSVWFYMATLPTELPDLMIIPKSAAINWQGGGMHAVYLPHGCRHTAEPPIVHTGFEPVSPDPKSGMIDHYTKGLRCCQSGPSLECL